jgi:hypothetical protein
MTAPGSPWMTMYLAVPRKRPVGARNPGSSKSFMMFVISSGLNWTRNNTTRSQITRHRHQRRDLGRRSESRTKEQQTKPHTYRREVGALSPDGAVVAEDGGGGEVVPLYLAHQVVVNVRLPRHLADWISLLTQTEGKKIELEGEDLSLSLSLSGAAADGGAHSGRGRGRAWEYIGGEGRSNARRCGGTGSPPPPTASVRPNHPFHL